MKLTSTFAYIVLSLALMVPCQAGNPLPVSSSSATIPEIAQPLYLNGKAILVSEHDTILYGKAALALFNQCSRSVPKHDRDYWTPSPSDIRRLENDVPEFLKTHPLSISGSMISDYRQYAGFISKGRRLIYINGFSDNGRLVFSAKGKVVYSPSGRFLMEYTSWQYEAVAVCDGGSSFYGIVYDPQTRQFGDVEYNGAA